jgi:peptidoglycan/xylan/chitin deacetylase (PgdA/CDA1 family)
VIRHALAPVHAASAAALGLPRTLDSPGVAITFDDGPHPDGTPAVLELLAARRAKASFFVIGEQVARRPELARRILAEGHALALHGDRHRLQLRLTRAQVGEDLRRGLAAVEDATGAPLTRHRPPFGIYSQAGLEAARALGLAPLLWARWGKDWRKLTTPARIAARATAGIRPGDVILLHDADFYSAERSHERTAAALPLILDLLASRGIGTVLAV